MTPKKGKEIQRGKMETLRERKDRGRLLPVEAMRGTAVGSFLFGSVNAHVPHIFVQLFG